jgi:NADH-quinone oxidoreductase subunit J
MNDLLFYVLATLAVAGGFLVVLNPFTRSPVTSAMFLVLTIGTLAGLFVLLHAFFLAAVQVLIYAGAVMVLFLFVIMMLDLREEQRKRLRRVRLGVALVASGGFLVLLLRQLVGAAIPAAGAAGAGGTEGVAPALGRMLLTTYLLPFELVSVILLVAMVGVVLLTKKDLK